MLILWLLSAEVEIIALWVVEVSLLVLDLWLCHVVVILLKLPSMDPSGLIVTFAPESGTKLVTDVDESVFTVTAPWLMVEVSTDLVVAFEVLSV